MRALMPVLLVCLLAGCAEPMPTAAPTLGGEAAPTPPVFETATAIPCPGDCFEPSVAVDREGRVFVTVQRGDALARSLDGGATFEALPAPPLPGGAPPALPLGPAGTPVDRYGSIANRADALVQVDAQGRLYWSALVAAAQGIQVARSDDGGETWTANTLVSWIADPATMPGPGVWDRQWMGFGPDGEAYLAFSHIPTGLHLARSDDGGASWGPWVRFAPVEERRTIGLAGLPVVDAEGRLLVPYLMGPPSVYGPLAAGSELAVRLGVSDDGGATWRSVDIHAPADGARAADSGPILALGPDGALHTTWLRVGAQQSYEVLVASSFDGGETWTEPAAWASAASGTEPGIAAGELGVRVAWHDAAGAVRVAWGSHALAREGEALVAEGLEATHFVSLAAGPDGRAYTAFSAEGEARVAFEAH